MHISLGVNGQPVEADVEPRLLLVHYLRDHCGLTGTHVGCETGICGACTVLVDGKAMRSCVMPVATIGSKKIVTLEGLGGPGQLHPLQRAFIDEQAVQCGYCINGMIMQSAAFLAKTKSPSEDQIKQALADNLCRCGTHVRILRAVKRAAANI